MIIQNTTIARVTQTRLAERRIAVLVLPSFSNLVLAAVMEPLRVANRRAGRALYGWQIVSETGGPISSSSGLSITTDAAMAAAAPFDALFVVASYDAERHASHRVRQFVRAAARSGALIAGLESASYVLAAAGVLDGHRATTHWEDLADFAERFPQIDVVPDRFVVDRNRLTSSGALPTLDLVLDLVRREHGLSLALAVSGTFIYDQAPAGQDPQRMIAAGRLGWQDPLLVRAIRLMEDNIETALPVDEIARQVGVGGRELLRRFAEKLKTSPKAYYTGLRLTLARRLLENTARPVSEIALSCGFGSGSAFARAFRDRFGLSPSQFRTSG